MKMFREKLSKNVFTYQYPTNKTNREPPPSPSFGDRLDRMDSAKKARQDSPSGQKQSLPPRASAREREAAIGVSEYVKDYIAGRTPRRDFPGATGKRSPAPSRSAPTRSPAPSGPKEGMGGGGGNVFRDRPVTSPKSSLPSRSNSKSKSR